MQQPVWQLLPATSVNMISHSQLTPSSIVQIQQVVATAYFLLTARPEIVRQSMHVLQHRRVVISIHMQASKQVVHARAGIQSGGI